MSDTPASSTPPSDHVPFTWKLAYGLAGPVDIWAVWLPLGVIFPVFNMGMHVPASLISLMILLFRLWDGITDPVMGWISDNTRTRWGRRRPWIVIGAILAGITFPIGWLFPPSLAEHVWHLNLGFWETDFNGVAVWYFGFGLLFYTCFTIWAMPYQSLLLEMTPDYHERTRVTSYRAFFQTVATIANSAAWWLTLSPFFTPEGQEPNTATGMRGLAIAIGIAVLVLGILPGLVVRERYYKPGLAVKQEKVKLWASIATTLSNRPYMILFGVLIMLTIGTNMVNNFLQYVGTFYVLAGDEGRSSWYNMVGGWMYVGSNIVGILLFRWVAEKIGKKPCLYIGLAGVIIQNAANYFLFNPLTPDLMLLNSIFLGAGNAAIWLMIPSMTADVVDYDELQTGKRREGSFAAVGSWGFKVSMSIGVGLMGPMLDLTGFDIANGANQPAEVFNRMRLWMAMLPAVVVGLGLIFVSFYPLTKSKVDAIRTQLEERRGAV